jgi:hypothetical protein
MNFRKVFVVLLVCACRAPSQTVVNDHAGASSSFDAYSITAASTTITWPRETSGTSQAKSRINSKNSRTALDNQSMISHTQAFGLKSNILDYFWVHPKVIDGRDETTGNNSFTTIVPGTIGRGWTQLDGPGLASSGACPGPPYDKSIYDGSTAWMSAEGCGAVVNAWGGGVLRIGTNQIVLWGGGHSDYGGNEIYTVSFTNNPVTYQRVFGPTLPGVAICSAGANCARAGCSLPISGSGSSCVEGDAAPNSRHTYGGMTYIPANSDATGTNHEELFILGGSPASQGGGGANDAWMYDFAANRWTRISSLVFSTLQDQLDNVVEWDPIDKVVYMLTYGKFGVYNPSSTPTTTASGSLAGSRYKGLANTAGITSQYATIDQANRTIVAIRSGVLDNASSGVYVEEYKLSNGSVTSTKNPSGCPSSIGSDGAFAGATYDSSLGKVVFYYPQNDNGIYIWDHSTHTCTRETYGGTAPSGLHAKGALGRFRYIPGKDYYVYVGDAEHAPFILCRKLAGCAL